MTKLLKEFAENVYINLIVGLTLFITAATEIVRTMEEGVIGAHHGVAVYGLLQIFRVLHDLQHGAEHLTKMDKD